MNAINESKTIVGAIDLEKFIIDIKFNSGFKIKSISKLLALTERHIEIYANTISKLNLFLFKYFSIDSYVVYFNIRLCSYYN
jgi:hypothetical protein